MNFIGHGHVLKFLTQALQSSQLSPSLLFVGPNGVGKRSVATELAQALLCVTPRSDHEENTLSGCHQCLACRKVENNNHPDLLEINRETQSRLLREKAESQTAIKIESIRLGDKFLQLKPLEGKRRIVIVDEAEKMTPEAAHAFLKTLEEPPNNGQIILLATDDRNLPTTILSRCAVLRFKNIPMKDLANWLNKSEGVEAEQALAVAEKSGGSFSRALRLIKEKDEAVDLSKLTLEEFFEAVGSPQFRKEARERAQSVLLHLVERSQRELESGDLDQIRRLNILLRSRKQLDRHVSPRLVLENTYLKLSQSKLS